ncbi:MAG: hypothetical protein LBS64_05730 [Spirochaetaceae bacterium]|jgi:hypothetical protein|nr:hypothetical protein [Spirochaetaceae bacterium]
MAYSDNNQDEFNSRAGAYTVIINSFAEKEKNLKEQITGEILPVGRGTLLLCDQALNRASVLLAINRLSVTLLKARNLRRLEDARKILSGVLTSLESVVTSWIDMSYTDNLEALKKIADVPVEKRLLLIQKFGLAMSLLDDEIADDSKQRWTMVDMEGRFAVVAKNILDMRTALQIFLNMEGGDYPAVAAFFTIIKRQLHRAVDLYRTRYNVLGRTADDDFRCAISCLAVLIRICGWTKDLRDVEEMRKKLMLWESQR